MTEREELLRRLERVKPWPSVALAAKKRMPKHFSTA